MESLIDIDSIIIAFAALITGACWDVVKYLKRDEHFPRVVFEVVANFVGNQDGKMLIEVLALLEKKD